ncbi:MAG: hypothetical protein Q9162_005500 [Coniocarpon cinnabarinum]
MYVRDPVGPPAGEVAGLYPRLTHFLEQELEGQERRKDQSHISWKGFSELIRDIDLSEPFSYDHLRLSHVTIVDVQAVRCRVVMFDVTGVLGVDLHIFEALYEAYGMDPMTFYYLYRQTGCAPEKQFNYLNYAFHLDVPLLYENIGQAEVRWLSIGSMHALYSVDSALMDSRPPTVIIALQDGNRRGNGYNPYAGPDFRSDFHSYAETAKCLAITESSIYATSPLAQETYQQTRDHRKAYLVALMQRKYSSNDDASQVRQLCVQSIVQYYTASHQLMLAEHNWTYHNEMFDDKDWPRLHSLPECWHTLRFRLQCLEHQMLSLSRLAELAAIPGVPKGALDVQLQTLQSLVEEYKVAVRAHREYIDAELNDALHTESRANLKLTQESIKEARQTGLLTFLAFIFVPFSIVTSVFGMNIQELNGSGQRIWVFVLTAIVCLLGLLSTYGIAMTLNVASTNYRQRSLEHKVHIDYILKNDAHGASFPKLLFNLIRKHGVKVIYRKGLSLGLLSRGRFDPVAVRQAAEWNVDKANSPLPGRLWQEWKYFLGLAKLHEKEDPNTPWRVRGDHLFKPQPLA